MSAQDTFESYQGGDYTVFVGRGMARFREGRVKESIADYDRALLLQPRLRPYMWQRGLSLYYADRFEEGAKQFRKDVDVNPSDMEEAIWAFMCEARIEGIGFDGARRQMLPAGADRRPYMRAAYALFSGESDELELARQMKIGTADLPVGSSGNKPAALAPYFYANLYLGLFAEAKGDAELARRYITAAAKSDYGASGDYMYDLAKVHIVVRDW